MSFRSSFGVAYMGLFFWSERYHTALFRYYPVLRRPSRARISRSKNAGPAILWYSWLFGAA